MKLNRSEVMKKAWQYRRAGKTWSESLKAAWADAFLSGFDFAPQFAKKASQPLVLDLRFSADVGKLRGMFANEVKNGIVYDYRIA